MTERIRRNQWWLLGLAGLLVGASIWVKTQNAILAIAVATLLYFLIILKGAAPWPVIWLLVSTAGLGGIVAFREVGKSLKVAGIGAGLGFLGGVILLSILAFIRKKAGRPVEAPEAPPEGLSVRTTVEGTPLAHSILQGPHADDILALLDKWEIEALKEAMLNPLGYRTSQQIAEAQEARRIEKPRRRLPKIGFGKKGIPRS